MTTHMTVKITEPQTEYEFTAKGCSIEECADTIRAYLDTTPQGTRVYLLDCSDEGEQSYEVAR